jgi:Zn-dependent peptidase ImmA (M78 family)
VTRHEVQAVEAAQAFRDDNGLGIAPIADLVALIEQTQDVDVTVLDVGDSDEHGLTMVDPARKVTIVAVARSENPMRWRSTLAHELGHLIFHDHDEGEPASLSTNAAAESRAQAFARHLLLPVAAVNLFASHRKGLDLAAFSDLVQRFEVSPAVAAIQIRDAKHITKARYDEWSSLYTPMLAARHGWMDQYRALQAESRQRRSPQRLLARAVSGYVAGVVTIETLASVRGIPVPDLAQELQEAGIAPTAEPDTELPTPTADDLADAGEFIDLSWLDDE